MESNTPANESLMSTSNSESKDEVYDHQQMSNSGSNLTQNIPPVPLPTLPLAVDGQQQQQQQQTHVQEASSSSSTMNINTNSDINNNNTNTIRNTTSSGTAFRSPDTRPAFKLAVKLIDTYKNINKIYYEAKAKRLLEQSQRVPHDGPQVSVRYMYMINDNNYYYYYCYNYDDIY